MLRIFLEFFQLKKIKIDQVIRKIYSTIKKYDSSFCVLYGKKDYIYTVVNKKYFLSYFKTYIMKTVTSKKTVQTETSKLIDLLASKNINGLTIEMLKQMSLQDLITLNDNLKLVNKKDGKKAKTNIAIEVLNHCLQNNVEFYSEQQLQNLVSRFNLKNYFELDENYDIFKTFELINIDILLNRIVSSKQVTQAERQTEWLKRKVAYVNSHLCGVNDKSSLFNNENATHYFSKQNGEFKLVEKSDAIKNL